MKIEEFIDSNFSKTLSDIKEIIQIPSVKGESTKDAPFGENLKLALEKTLKIAENLGFRTKNLDNYIGYAEIGEGDEYVAILGHIDVVPEGEVKNWSVNPYKGAIVNNHLVARGAIDNKGPIISALYSVRSILEEFPNFNKRIRVIFGTNEESGDEDIKYYLSKEKPPKFAFTPDGRFPVIFAEKGIYTFSYRDKINWEQTNVVDIISGTRSNIVPETAKLILKNISLEKIKDRANKFRHIFDYKFNFIQRENLVEVLVSGKSAHASSPEKGVNAIYGLYLFLNEILDENDSLKNFANFIATHIAETTNGQLLGIDSVDEEMGNLTISAGISKKINEYISVKFNIRYPISTDEKRLDTILFEKADENGILFLKENHNPPLYFSKDSILVKTLQDVYLSITKRAEEPAALGGGTYAKLMPNTVAFGPNFREFKGNAHSFDECMDLDMLKLGMKIYAHGILNLSNFI